MKALFYSAALGLSALLSPAAPALKAELLEPTDPIVLEADHRATLANTAAALKELQGIENAWKENPKAKRDFDRLGALQSIIAKGSELEQGVTLTLRLTNTSNAAITIAYGGDTSTNTLTITGPDALDLQFTGAMTREYRQGKPTTIAPGKSADFEIKELRYGARDSSRWLLTAPGEYVIKLAFRTHLGRKALELKTNKITSEVKE